MDDDFRQRAARRRRTWQATVERDGTHRPAERTDPDEALAIMWDLAVEAWTLSGRPMPEYTREEMPGRVIRRWGGE